MFALVKIRCKYLKRHCCAVYFSYLLIPTVIIIFTLCTGFKIHKHVSFDDDSGYQGSVLKSNIDLLEQGISDIE